MIKEIKEIIKRASRILPDEIYIKLMFFYRGGGVVNLRKPRGINEKIQWLKLNDHRKKYVEFSDKYLAKKKVADIIGEKHVIPLIAVWNDPDEIILDDLPDRFVIKCTHNSGEALFICTNKESLDEKRIKKSLKKALKKNYYYESREWAYKYIKPRVICEELVIDDCKNNNTLSLVNYNFYCFDGEPKFLYIRVDDVASGEKGLFFVNL